MIGAAAQAASPERSSLALLVFPLFLFARQARPKRRCLTY
jgi:hypothetical protein